MSNCAEKASCLAAAILLFGCTPDDPADSNSEVSPDAGERIDLIVHGRYVLTMDNENSRYEDGAVAIDDGVIVDIGEAGGVNGRYTADRYIAGENRVLMPGLVNGHSHAAMTILRGVADDLALMDWLNDYIFPAEVEFVDAEFVRIGTELACWEMIRGGTTTFVDMYYYPDTIADVVDRCGLRALISATVIDQRSPDAEGAADSIAKGSEFIERWQGRNSRITPIFGPHANYTLDAEQLRATREAAIPFGAPISIHVSESPFEVQYAKDTYGTTSIEMLESIGFFDGPTIAAHVVWPTEQEIPILADRKVGVIHNPTSNMKLASGISPVAPMLAAGVRMGLGTDGAASNNDLDMWEEMRLAALLQKVGQMNPEALPATAVLRMATSGGAGAIGLGDSIGSLEVGKRADLIQVAFDDVHHVPTYDIVSHLVYVTDEQDVETVVVDGKVLMLDGDVLSLDTARIAAEASALAAAIQAALAEKKRTVIRNIAAVLAGLVTAFVLIAVIQWLGHSIYPPPPELDVSDPDVMQGYMATLPVFALLFPIFAYIGGTFAGALLACSIATVPPLIPAAIVGVFVIAGTIANLLLNPHPLWFAVVALIGIAASTWLGMRLAPTGAPP